MSLNSSALAMGHQSISTDPDRLVRLDQSSGKPVLRECVSRLLRERKRRTEFFPNDLFADPAWDILLELSLAELEQHRVSISGLCFGMGVPQTTALRWIKGMTESGWLERSDDPLDARRKFVSLSPFASSRMHGYLIGLLA